jgi:hypothetical protein
MNDLKMDAILTYPKLDLNGIYQMSANFFGAPVNHEGNFSVSIYQSRARVSFKMEKYLEDNIEHIKFERVGVHIIGKSKDIQVNNVFGKNRAINDIANALIKENPIFQLEKLNPHFEKSLSDSMTILANKVVKKATFDEVFPL